MTDTGNSKWLVGLRISNTVITILLLITLVVLLVITWTYVPNDGFRFYDFMAGVNNSDYFIVKLPVKSGVELPIDNAALLSTLPNIATDPLNTTVDALYERYGAVSISHNNNVIITKGYIDPIVWYSWNY